MLFEHPLHLVPPHHAPPLFRRPERARHAPLATSRLRERFRVERGLPREEGLLQSQLEEETR